MGADLHLYHQYRIRDFYQWLVLGSSDPDRITTLELLSWIEHLPEESATKRALGSGWTTTESILARHNNDYRSANWDSEEGEPANDYFLQPPNVSDTVGAESSSATEDELRALVYGDIQMSDLADIGPG